LIGLVLAMLLQGSTSLPLGVALEDSTDYAACFFTEIALSTDAKRVIASLSPQDSRRHQVQYSQRRPVNRSTVPEVVSIDLDCRRTEDKMAACISPLVTEIASEIGDRPLHSARSIGETETPVLQAVQAFLDANPVWDIYQLVEAPDRQSVIAALISPQSSSTSRIVMFEAGRAQPLDLLRPCQPYWDLNTGFRRDRVEITLDGVELAFEHVWHEAPSTRRSDSGARVAIVSFDSSLRLPSALGHMPLSYAIWDERADLFILNPADQGLEPGEFCRLALEGIRRAFPERYDRIGVQSQGDGVSWVLPAFQEDSRCIPDFALLQFGWASPSPDADLSAIDFARPTPVHIRMDEEQHVEFSLDLVSRLATADTPLVVRVTSPNSPLTETLYPTLPPGSTGSVRRFLRRQIEGVDPTER